MDIEEKLKEELKKTDKKLVEIEELKLTDEKLDDIFQLRGYYLFRLGRYQEAVKEWSKAIEINPKSAESGCVKSWFGRHEYAIKDYDKANKKDNWIRKLQRFYHGEQK